MKYFFILTSALFVTTTAVHAQTPDDQDPKAKIILDRVSKKSENYTSLYSEFTYRIKNTSTAQKMDIVQKGKIWLKDKKYQIQLDNTVIINNGKAMYTMSPDDGTGLINDLPDAEELGIDISNLFNLHNSEFKYKLIKDESGYAHIDMFPKDPKAASFHTVSLKVNKEKNEVVRIVVKDRQSNVYIYRFDKFEPNRPISDAKIRFRKSDWPQVTDWTDLREG